MQMNGPRPKGLGARPSYTQVVNCTAVDVGELGGEKGAPRAAQAGGLPGLLKQLP